MNPFIDVDKIVCVFKPIVDKQMETLPNEPGRKHPSQ